MKRLSGILAFLFLLASFPLCALGEGDGGPEGQFTYTVEDGGAVITGYLGSEANLVIPDALGGFPVTAIGYYAFGANETIRSVVLPGSLTRIENNAFDSCGSLVAVTLPEGLAVIGEEAFQDCVALVSAALPEGLVDIRKGAFQNCAALASVAFPQSLAVVGEEAFSSCVSLASATFPEGLTGIGDRAFSGCASLVSVQFPSTLKTIGISAFENCAALDNVDIPESVTGIGSGAFSGCAGLRSVRIPASVSRMGEAVFQRCSALTDMQYYGTPVDAGAVAENYVWITEALELSLGMDLSAFVPSSPQHDVCLLVVGGDSRISFGDDPQYVADADTEKLQNRVKIVKDWLINNSNGKLSFTSDPDNASVLVLMDVRYPYIGKARSSDKVFGAFQSTYDCEVTLTATDLRTQQVIMSAIESHHLHAGDTIGWTSGENGIYADFPDLRTSLIERFVYTILRYADAGGME